MNIVLSGHTKAGQQLRAAAASTPSAQGAAFYEIASQVLTVSQRDYVPVETGALRASGFVEPPITRGAETSVTVGFGGPAAPYAVIVHEDLTKRHPVGQAKYLELPLRAALEGMPAVLTQRQNDAIRQAFQRLQKVEQNVAAGRDTHWGMPLFASS